MADVQEKSISQRVREIEIIARRLVSSTLAGQYHAVFKGRGMSFDSVREYQPGDDIRTIDWNVSARTGGIFVKQYVEERELTVLLVVDLSDSQKFGSKDKSKRELAAEIAAVLAFSAISNNDRVGLILYTDRIERYIPPKKGRGHVMRIVQELLRFQPVGKTTRTDLALDYVARIARKRAVVFVLSDFLGDGYERSLGVLAGRHDVVPIVTADEVEKKWPLPKGIWLLEDAETDAVHAFDANDRQSLQDYWQKSAVADRKREQLARKFGMEPIPAMVGVDYLKSLVAYFRRRAARQ
jgi:uncharacterized protein (DUF58 family)